MSAFSIHGTLCNKKYWEKVAHKFDALHLEYLQLGPHMPEDRWRKMMRYDQFRHVCLGMDTTPREALVAQYNLKQSYRDLMQASGNHAKKI